jgi:hypothetical protein
MGSIPGDPAGYLRKPRKKKEIMTNIVTRKGLAFGALVALASTGIAGAPAFAADLTLAPAAGSTYNVLLGDSFTLSASVAGVTPIGQTNNTLKYEIVNATGATLVNSGEYWDTTANANVGGYVTASTTTSGTTTQIVTPAAGKVTQTLGKVNKLTINPTTTSSSATFEVVVRAFADLDGSGSVTSGDLVSDPRTVKFIKGSEVTGTLALDAVNAGVAPTASLTFNSDINYEQTAAPTAVFTVNGTADSGSGSVATGSLNSDKNAFTFVRGIGSPNAAAGDIISAKASWLRYDSDSTKASATSSTLAVAAASTASTGTQTLSTSKDVADTTAANGTNDVERLVRAGVKTLTAKVSYKNSSSVALGAGAPVTVAITANTLALGEEVTVGSKTVKASSTSATYYTTTDANGEVVIPVTAKNGGDATDVTITVTSASVVKTFGLLWQTAAATSLVETKAPLGYATRVIKAGSSFDVAYVLVDQFKQPFTKTDYNYRVVLSTNGNNTIASPYVALVNGVGSATVVENDPAAAGFTLTATAQQQTGTGAWGAIGSGVSTTSVVTVATIKDPASVTLGTVLVADTSTYAPTASTPVLGALANKDLAALDRRVDTNTAAATGFTGVATKLSGVVKAADGSVVAGAAVKVAAAGQAFSTSTTGDVYVAMNEITVYTDASGAYTVYAFSKTAGTITYTTTAGSLTKTQDVKYAGVTTAGAGSVLSLVAPASSQAGRSVDVTSKLVDKYGNPISGVTVTFAISGAGYLSATSGTTATDGTVSVKVIAGVNEIGDAVVTSTATIDSKDSAVAKTVTFGSTDGYIDVLNGKRASVTWSFAKGKRVAVYLDGVRRYNIVQPGDSELNLQFNLKKGSHSIKLVIGGVIVDTLSVKVAG